MKTKLSILILILGMSFNSFAQTDNPSSNSEKQFSFSSGFFTGETAVNKTDAKMRTFGTSTSAGILTQSMWTYVGASMIFGDSASKEKIGLNQINLFLGFDVYPSFGGKVKPYIGVGLQRSFLQLTDEKIFDHRFSGGFAKVGTSINVSENIGLFFEVSYSLVFKSDPILLNGYQLSFGLRFH